MSYRTENGDAVLDVRVSKLDRLFDNRDPAPFRERDLDPALVEYLVDWARDVPRSERMRLVFWIAEPCPPEEVQAAVRTHFEYEIERAVRRRREHLRTGWVALLIAVLAVVALTALGAFVTTAIAGTIGEGIREALIISGWVLLWRPVDLLVYDGIPSRRERRVLGALRDAAVEVRNA